MMTKKWFEKSANNFIYLIVCILFFFAMFMSLISGTAILYGIQFVIFQVFFLLLPGVALALLFKVPIHSRLELIALGYLLGYAVNIFNYYIMVLLGYYSLMKYLLMLEGIVAVGICYHKRSVISEYEEDYRGNLLCILALIIMIGLKVIMYYGMNRVPYKAETRNFITADILFYIGNAIELTKEYPPKDFRVLGEDFYYYYWGSMQLAVIRSYINMAIFEIESVFSFMQGPMLLVMSMYLVMRKKVEHFWFRCYGMVSVLLLTGYETIMSCTYAAHIYICSFGFDIGIAYLLLTLYFAIHFFEDTQGAWRILLLLLIALAVTTGSKAPLAVILMVALGLICAYELLWKHRWRSIPAGLCMLGTFIGIYFTVVSHGMDTIQSDKGLVIQFMGAMRQSPIWMSIDSIVGNSVFTIPIFLLTAVLFLLISNPNVYVCVGLGLTCNIRNKGKSDAFSRICLITGLIAILFFAFTHQEGKSEAYFLMCGYPFLILYGIAGMDRWSTEKSRKLSQSILVIVGVMIIFTQYYSYFRDGFKGIIGRLDTIYEEDQYNLMTHEEYAAYDWIRVNTDSDAILMSNVMLQEKQGRSFITGVMTERQLWLEGWEYGFGVKDMDLVERKRKVIDAVMKGDREAIDMLKQQGVSYIIQIKRITPDNGQLDQILYRVYDTDEIVIYQIK